MAFCANCGAEVQGRYCAKCGTPLAAGGGSETVPPADIVTLDRVINVSPDWQRLIQLSAARARRLYGLVYPRDTLPVRMVVGVMNLLMWRGPVHAAIRPLDEIDRLAREAGLVRYFSNTAGPWQVAVYRRD